MNIRDKMYELRGRAKQKAKDMSKHWNNKDQRQ